MWDAQKNVDAGGQDFALPFEKAHFLDGFETPDRKFHFSPDWKKFGGRWQEIEGDLDYDVWRRGVAAAVAGYPGAAVFSHYVAINAAVSTATGDDLVMGFRPDHCSIQVFDAVDDGLILIAKGREASTQVL